MANIQGERGGGGNPRVPPPSVYIPGEYCVRQPVPLSWNAHSSALMLGNDKEICAKMSMYNFSLGCVTVVFSPLHIPQD